MKPLLFFCFAISIHFLSGFECGAQTPQVKFNLVTGTNGVSLGKINGMTRDKFGFMWFSGETSRSIIRYDGNNMTRFFNDSKNSNSLGGFYPECLAADADGNIWIGFYGQGVDKFDQFTNTFTHYRHNENDEGSLLDDVVSAILVDHLGNVWVGSDSGLDMLDKATGKFRHFQNNSSDPTSLSHNVVRSIYEDKDGELWVGTGMAFDESPQGGLNRFNRSNGTFTRFLHDEKNQNSLIDNRVRSIFEDSYGVLWIGTNGDGLHTMDKKTGKITRHTYNSDQPDLLSRPPVQANVDHITFITEDSDHKIWVGTLTNGLTRYDPKTKQLDRFGDDDDKTGILKDNQCWWAYASSDGIIWMSTQNSNLYKIDIHHSVFPYIDHPNGLFAFTEENDSISWFGTLQGLERKNTRTGATDRFTYDRNDPASLSSNEVQYILKDKRGQIWVGTNNGFNLFNPINRKFKRYNYDSAAANINNQVISICEDSQSNIWAGTFAAGLVKLDRATGELTHFVINRADSNSISRNTVLALLDGDDDDLWVGTYNQGGLNKLNKKTGRFSYYLPGHNIYSLYRDAGGIIWVGTNDGLFSYDKKSDTFNSLAVTNAGSNIVEVSTIVGDNDNNLWVGTRTGIHRINEARNQSIRFGGEKGIPDTNNRFAVSIKKGDGQLVFVVVGYGYHAFYPQSIQKTSEKSPLYFTHFWLSDKEVMPGKESPLKESLFSIKEINLPHDQNVFSFSFTFTDFRNEGDQPIYYKLENYDEEWRSAEREERLQYYRVPPGDYTLSLKTPKNLAGEWLTKSIAIHIAPPWWATYWAYGIYLILFGISVVAVHRFQKDRVIRAERERTREKELAQAKEIEKAYTELKSTQSQLIQSEKMASLGELTAGIAHEIQNPLNFVNNFSEINHELIRDLKSEIKKGNTEEVTALANDIESNEEKISHHGKRADAIVKSMLQHSQKSSGQKELTDINALCDEYLRLAYHGLRAKDKYFNSKLETQLDPTLPKLNVIPQDIGRVLLNLINNAFYAVSEKSKVESQKPGSGYEPIVSVFTKNLGDKIEINVKDNGSGIPDAIREKIFQPFFTTKPTGQGTGLGLSLSYDIVKAHGGELKVNSTESKGSDFTIQLPNH